jgi:hypothetical protein
MSKFTFKVVNNRGDETQHNLMLTATSDSGLECIQLGEYAELSLRFGRVM